MTLALSRTFQRPFRMAPFGAEAWRDLFSDRLWPDLFMDNHEDLVPNVDFIEKDGKYLLHAELPGLNKDDISISIEDGYVTVSGRKETSKEEEGTTYYLKETRSGSFSRSFRLPGKVDRDKVDATFKDGVLTVTMPMEKAPEARKIKIH
ncbi:MAG: Hsp20/alpha crystallin family protein [Deltaproteobacteria bacterium]|nr:Hsp20/alpha crystallin family protein [Deltaproteobacteria bacterium]HDZ90896.1 Hsp20/alpha crystallin family protein [Deltaproteobacteria bacterium]